MPLKANVFEVIFSYMFVKKPLSTFSSLKTKGRFIHTYYIIEFYFSYELIFLYCHKTWQNFLLFVEENRTVIRFVVSFTLLFIIVIKYIKRIAFSLEYFSFIWKKNILKNDTLWYYSARNQYSLCIAVI